MSFIDGLKGIFSVSEEDYEDDFDEMEEEQTYREETKKRMEPQPKTVNERKTKTVQFNPQNMQVVLVKPERFDDVGPIADHLCNQKTVVLNLESADRDVSRRLIDFLSGVAYAKNGKIRKVANSTFVLTPAGVDISGDVVLDDFDDGRIYM